MKRSSSNTGNSFVGLLQLLFIGLKLTGHISWPWWQVLLPTIIGGSFVVIMLIVGVYLIISEAIDKFKKNQLKKKSYNM